MNFLNFGYLFGCSQFVVYLFLLGFKNQERAVLGCVLYSYELHIDATVMSEIFGCLKHLFNFFVH